MADFQLPVDSTFASFTQQFDLEGETFTFEFRWSERDGAWYLSVRDDDDAYVFAGEKILASWQLGKSQSTILGTLLTMDEERSGVPPTRYELGNRVKLYYRESA